MVWGGYKWSYYAILKDKSIHLLLPGLVFSIVALVLKMAFPDEMSRQVGLRWQDVAHSYLYPNDNPMRELWFIATLFWFFVLTPLWRAILKRKWTMWVMLAAIADLHFVHPYTELLCIGRVFSYAIWFYLGLVISKEDMVEGIVAKCAWWTLLLGIILYIAGNYSDAFVTTIGGIIGSFALALIADKYISKLFCGFRNYTYQIFLMGIFAQMFVKIIYRYVSIPYIVAYVLCILMGLYVPVLVSKLIEKINWKPLSLCVGLYSINK